MKKKLDQSTIDTVIQFAKFGIVGVSNTGVSYVINIGMLWILQNLQYKYDYMIANVAAFLLSVLWSFYWNDKYVFVTNAKQNQSKCVRLLRMYASYAFTGIILNNIFSYVWISILSISKIIAPLINCILVVPINYILNKKWAFGE